MCTLYFCSTMSKAKHTIPVIDMCSLQSVHRNDGRMMAEPFAAYLVQHPGLHLPHRHSFYHIVLFTEGSGFHGIDFQQFPVRPRDIYFMKPGQVHSWDFEDGVDGYVINFPDHFFDHFLAHSHYLEQFPFFQGLAEDCVVSLDPEACKTVNDICSKIVLEQQAARAYSDDLVKAYLLELFIVVSRCVSVQLTGSARPHNQLLLHNFRKLVDMHYAEMRLPKEYAALLYITPNHLNSLCNELLDKSAGAVIRDRILLEAKRLLINAELSISAIAAALDFTDNAHFSRFFKKHTHLTPDEFRRSTSVHSKK